MNYLTARKNIVANLIHLYEDIRINKGMNLILIAVNVKITAHIFFNVLTCFFLDILFYQYLSVFCQLFLISFHISFHNFPFFPMLSK